MAQRWTLTVRSGSRVERSRFDDPQEAIAAMKQRLGELSGEASAKTINFLTRRFDPVRQVLARAEISGPGGSRAGVDLHGDGSTQAYTGRIRRSPVELRAGEDAYEGLRRTVGHRPAD